MPSCHTHSRRDSEVLAGGIVNRMILCLILIVTSFISVRASVFGDVKGVVLDPQQRAIAGARITLASRSSSFSRTTITDVAGEFSFRAVPVGEYTVNVESSGFSKSTLAVTVLSDRTSTLSVPLKIASVSQQVEVNVIPGEVRSESPTPVTLVNRRQISETPGASRTNSLAMITDYVPG